MSNTITLLCKSVAFCSYFDEELFFKWIDQIPAITGTDAQFDELYLYIKSHDIPNQDLGELLALFYRYNIDMQQLQVFLTEKNREWFYDNPQAFWHDKVFKGEHQYT